jgi:hypothetical protein
LTANTVLGSQKVKIVFWRAFSSILDVFEQLPVVRFKASEISIESLVWLPIILFSGDQFNSERREFSNKGNFERV